MNPYFEERVRITELGCWEWQRAMNQSGYGFLSMKGRSRTPIMAHRLSYEMHVGPIPEGMTVDHLCFNTICVAPAHLRLLTRSENARNQRDAFKTHCKRGHEFTPENTRIKAGGNGVRDCKTCHRDRERLNRRRRLVGVTRPGTPRGERVGSARLTEADVIEIRALYAAGESISAIARSFGITRSPVQGIVHGRAWTHVKEQQQ